MNRFDIIIIGGGIVGVTAACALGEAGMSVALIEARAERGDDDSQTRDPRVFAISRASERIFRSLGVWDAMVAQGAHAFRDMEVWDATGSGVAHFDCAELGEPCLGYIIEPRVIQTALMQKLGTLDSVTLFRPAQFSEIRTGGEQAEVSLKDGRTLTAALVIGADGSRSAVRELLGIKTRTHDYGQSSLVALVKTAQPHLDTAWQRFLPGGPLAFLPMDEGWSSIVWTLPAERAQQMLELDAAGFHEQLAQAFDHRLGDIVDSEQRQLWPLQKMHAEHYVSGRAALVGDAAHVIHPLAGQGVNLGLLDVAVLAEVIQEAKARARDIGSYPVLRRYERWRRGDNLLMMSAMDGFNRLFSNEQAPLGWLRNLGLSMANRLGPARHVLMRHAMGLSGDLPRLARRSG